MEADEKTLLDKPETLAEESPQITAAFSDGGRPAWIEPDLDFIHELGRRSDYSFEKCFQCGTCSATCAISPDLAPFPRKEMVWAAWGMKDRLLADPDVWLCYQCNDCTTRCPRGARPGDVLAAVRQLSIRHYATPRFLGKWVNQPQCIPLLLGIPTALLTLALIVKNPLADLLGLTPLAGEKISYAYSSLFPHWLLNSLFLLLSVLILLAAIAGGRRYWRAMTAGAAQYGIAQSAKDLFPSILSTVKNIIIHGNFTKCTAANPRLISHISVFFGFAALTAVTLWVITSGINPFIKGDFVYPFGFWSPWKILANIGGLALVAGCLLMIRDRLRDSERFGSGTFFDWSLIAMLLLAALTGFFTEILHYARLEPHRHIVYFVHLVFVGALLIYLPYSKFAHLVYRTIAMVFAEHTGRTAPAPPNTAGEK